MIDVFIRTDGSTDKGLGHLVRSISLAHMLKPKFDVTFVCRELPEATDRELVAMDVGLVRIGDEQEFFDILTGEELIVLDGYQFNTAYQQRITDIGCRLVCIDDLHDSEVFADLVINHSPGVLQSDYRTRSDTRFALGPDYALLRPGFLAQAQKSRRVRTVENVLISFGGSDPKDLSSRVATLLSAYKQIKKIVIVTGSVRAHRKDFTLGQDSRIQHYHSVDEQQMLTLFLQGDLAVVPASGVLFEAISAGCRVISGYYNDNQLDNYNGFRELGAFVDARSFEESDITAALNQVLEMQSEEINSDENEVVKIIDGHSGERILEQFLELVA